LELARLCADRQARLVRRAVDAVAQSLSGDPSNVIVSGSGEFLARRVLDLSPALTSTVHFLAEILGPEVSTVACAHALAVLASETDDEV
jgi:uncharacterized hydantoinase/oxoprolinase family protein